MRIRFLREVEVELADIPATAWGVILKRPHSSERPFIDPQTQSFTLPVSSRMRDVFPAGVVADLPDRLAAVYLAAGDAEKYVSGITGERLPEGSLDIAGA